MRIWLLLFLWSAVAGAQTQPATATPATATPAAATPATPTTANSAAAAPPGFSIPAGTKIPLVLRHAISTRGTHEGDAVYAQTTFPFALHDRILVPAGTYVQGRIAHIQRAGRVKGRAEVLMHFTALIYPSGYTVVLPGSLNNAPGVDHSSVSDKEGTLKSDSQTGQKVEKAATTGAEGAIIGSLADGAKGALIGGGAGGAAGTVLALLTRGNDVKMDAGTTLEMVIERDVPLDGERLSAR